MHNSLDGITLTPTYHTMTKRRPILHPIVVPILKPFDSNDDFLGEKTFAIRGLRSKGKTGSSTTFTITYEEENVAQIDHLKLQAVEEID